MCAMMLRVQARSGRATWMHLIPAGTSIAVDFSVCMSFFVCVSFVCMSFCELLWMNLTRAVATSMRWIGLQ